MNEEKVLRNLNSAFAVMLIVICCLLPVFDMNAYEVGYTNTLGISGMESLMGMTFSDGTEMGMNISALFLFLFPLALILSHQVAKFRVWEPYYIFIAPYGCIVSLFVTHLLIDKQMNASVSAGTGYWIYLLFSLIMLGVGYRQFKLIGKTQEKQQKFTEQEIGHLQIAPLSPLQEKTVCPSCGAVVGKNKKFCAACGASLVEYTRHCTQCNAIVPEDAKFCKECGAKYIDTQMKPEKKCPKCGRIVDGEEKFCMECGTAISE